MLNTIEAIVQNGQIIPLENIEIPDGTKALVTLLAEEGNEFWLSASENSLDEIWNNEEDDVYAELLKK
ncbi:MAG: antitoxin family protein [Pyrinomonadaceae bacterium]